MLSKVYANGLPQVSFSFSELTAASNVTAMFTNRGSTTGVCTTAAFRNIPIPGICAFWCLSVAHAKSALNGCSLQCFEWGEPPATQAAVLQLFNQYGGHTALVARQRVASSFYLTYMARRGFLFQVFFHPMTVKLLVSILVIPVC